MIISVDDFIVNKILNFRFQLMTFEQLSNHSLVHIPYTARRRRWNVARSHARLNKLDEMEGIREDRDIWSISGRDQGSVKYKMPVVECN